MVNRKKNKYTKPKVLFYRMENISFEKSILLDFATSISKTAIFAASCEDKRRGDRLVVPGI